MAQPLWMLAPIRSIIWLGGALVLAYLKKPDGASFLAVRTDAIGWLGGGIVLVGLAFHVWSNLTLARSEHHRSTTASALVVDGPFQYVRNPIYVAGVTLLLGVSLLYSPWRAVELVLPLLILGFFHLRVILAEEPALRRRFGKIYEEYCGRVPRWLPGALAILILIVALPGANVAAFAQALPRPDRPDPLLCRPTTQGPFAVVIWNHGLVTDRATFVNAQRGWKNMCEALAAEGYLAYVPIRPFVASLGPAQIANEADELAKVVNRVMAMPDVDRRRVVLMGHSRGAILALMVAVKRKDLAAVVVTAPARIPPRFLGDTFNRARSMPTPVLLMVESSDELGGPVAVQDIEAELKRRRPDDHRTIRYDRGGGHFLFVRKDYWWDDLKTFLGEKLSQP